MSERKSKRRTTSGGGGSLITLTWVILLILKLAGPLDHMKWYWVFSPLWISIGLGILFLMCVGTILLAAVFGIASSSSQMVVGIKNWFTKQAKEDEVIDVEAQEDSSDNP
ncbi:MAG: hypothetical protein ACTSQ3_01750 [Candidatus Heimdallarchaeota archaeon]